MVVCLDDVGRRRQKVVEFGSAWFCTYALSISLALVYRCLCLFHLVRCTFLGFGFRFRLFFGVVAPNPDHISQYEYTVVIEGGV